MVRPHESNDLRLTDFTITTTPKAAQHWVHDVFSNSKVIMSFDETEPCDTLEIVCDFTLVRSSVHEPNFPIAESVRNYPFSYPPEQWPDLISLINPEYNSPEQEVKNWAEETIQGLGGDTWEILNRFNTVINETFDYQRREEPGIQPPRETLAMRRGSCRDFAVLMMEAVRQLGFAARFVTGYLYDPMTDQNGAMRGAGATHAWVQVFLPGAGWIEFDPTNGLIASGRLIRTGVARHPAQAVPLDGSFQGAAEDFLGLQVSVEVSALAPTLRG